MAENNCSIRGDDLEQFGCPHCGSFNSHVFIARSNHSIYSCYDCGRVFAVNCSIRGDAVSPNKERIDSGFVDSAGEKIFFIPEVHPFRLRLVK